jgi:geranylgeranyl pyrophosphate synthase
MARINKRKLMMQALKLFEKEGQKAFKNAREAILREKFQCTPLKEAVAYFMDNWSDVQHPALLSLACKSVGGHPNIAVEFGTAFVLLTSAADIHDDIIDQSITKNGKLTVLGKFGRNIALLAGDALLFKGLIVLQDACQRLDEVQRQEVMKLTENAFFNIAFAETKEVEHGGKHDLTPEEYLNIFEMKAAVAELTMRIGAIVGGGTSQEINALGNYGRTLGILMAIRDDFIDMFEPEELKNRFKNECLPLPILYAFQDPKIKEKIVFILKKNGICNADAYRIVKIVIETREFQGLKKKIRFMVKKGLDEIRLLNKNFQQTLSIILKASLEDVAI